MAAETSSQGVGGISPISISALQHVIYCLRQAALIHLEQMWADNSFTAKGHVFHKVADKPGGRKVRGVRREMALPLACKRLNLVGKADCVEFHETENGGETPFPIEYKRGKPKLHRADEVQLCAQAFCLEEMTGQKVPEGALYYGLTKRRVAVPFDEELRNLTQQAALSFGGVLASGKTPPAQFKSSRCRACSLLELCRPKIATRSVVEWREKTVESLLQESSQ